ncbi:MAG: DNA polymerase III subunit beta [Proteobacteria bacterium]|nr:DNA polymerase III subunit beta [Pseudomonadota bacterium]MBU2252492.1 DNA polymerase III subunit beta [Pseudomonadota bacterium]
MVIDMEFNVKREIFLTGIQKTLGIVEKKTTMPILSNLLLRAADDRLTIIATDREIGLVADYEAEIIQGGEITLSARKLHEMVREVQGEKIHVVKNERDMVMITCNKAVYRIPGIPADDYPVVAGQEEIPQCRIKGGILKELIRRTAFAMSTDETRKTLNGVFLETEKSAETSMIRMVATDGHRLALMKIDTGEKDFLDLEKGVIVPRKGIGEIRRLVDEEIGDMFLGIGKGMLMIKTDHTLLKVSLIDGEYPDYSRVIPVGKGLVVTLEKDKFIHALRRMSVISSERYNGVIITISEGRLVMNSTNPDVGEANDEIDISYSGEERSTGYNVTYLSDAVEVIDEGQVEFEIGAGMKPGVVRSIGNENYFCIVMPLKL